MKTNWKKMKQFEYWLKKAMQYGIPTYGREKLAAREAEALYRRKYRQAKKERVSVPEKPLLQEFPGRKPEQVEV